MPGKATVKGTLKDVFSAPIVGGKIIATMVGSDAFENGSRIASRKVDATTGADGSWSLSLIVNGEGRHGSSSWTIEAYDATLVSIYRVEKLFILTTADILLDDLEQVSIANKTAAAAAGTSRTLVADSLEEYLALPEANRKPSDIILRKIL